jgi:AGZA family xanthine/uracil permease-like MFS transporter
MRTRIAQWLDQRFRLQERGTSLTVETVAGLTTFATMSYILAVNPLVLAKAGMDQGAQITVTALVSGLCTLLMGWFTNYPFALAPLMGTNAFLAYQVCQGMNVPWQAAMGLVFYNGLIFLLLAVTGLRQTLIDAFPAHLKTGIMAGIGLFISLLGLKACGIVVVKPTGLGLGTMRAVEPVLATLGLALLALMMKRGIRTSMILSILAITVVGWFLPGSEHGHVTAWPTGILSWPASMSPLFGKLDFGYPFRNFRTSMPILLALLFTDVLSTMAAQVALGQRAKLADASGNLPLMGRALGVDAVSSSIGAVFGTSTVGFYVESAAGVEQGGRTGLTSVVTALCFFGALFLKPLIEIVPGVATAPALIMIGILMMREFAEQSFPDLSDATPAIFTLLLMAFTSVSDGIALGFLFYLGMALLQGKWRALSAFSYALGILFLFHYALKA